MIDLLWDKDVLDRVRLDVSLAPIEGDDIVLYTDANFYLELCSHDDVGAHFSKDYKWWVRRRATLCYWVYDQRTGAETEASIELPQAYYGFFTSDLKTYISQAEMVAAVCLFWSRPDLVAGRRIIHFIDNTSALSGLVNGYSSKPDIARLINLFHVATIALGCEWWGEWVPSAANLADIPTREKSASLRPPHVADGGEIELPPLDWSAGQLRDWMLKLEERFASEKAKAAARREASAAAGVAADAVW